MKFPEKSPIRNIKSLFDGRLEWEEKETIVEKKERTAEDLLKAAKEHQAKTRAVVLEMLDDIPDADLKPPENVLFVCKLNPITEEKDLEVIFSKFGAIKKCEIVRDWKTGVSL